MTNVTSAVIMVVEFIVEHELYNFKSLAEETQERLISAYGSSFEQRVNQSLGFGLVSINS